MNNIFKFLIIGFILFTAANVYSATPSPAASETSFLWNWMGQQTATGDWAGLRNKLENKGLTVSSNYTTDIGGNPVGGLKQTVKYSGFLSLAFALDFEKLVSVKGLAFTLSNFFASGSDLSADIGTFYGVQEIYAPGGYFLGQMDMSLSLLNDTWTLEAGRLFAGDVFATSSLWQYYVSGGVNDNLNSMPANIFFPAFDIVSWAARATYQPNEQWNFVAGVYNANPNVADTNYHGTNFNFDTSDGCLTIAQMTYQHNYTRDKNS